MRLLAAISHHGLGHLAQSAPVLNALLELRPEIRLVVLSALPRDKLSLRLRFPFEHLAEPTDCGWIMHDAIRLDRQASLAAYRAFHDGWEERVGREAQRLRALGIDRVYSNVAYLPLAAAHRVGLPSAALCSINWLDIFGHYLGGAPRADRIMVEMRAAYGSAGVFLRPEPAMPMPQFDRTFVLPAIAQQGRKRGAELRDRLGLAEGTQLALLGMGGIDYRLPSVDWPESPDFAWLVPDNWETAGSVMPFSASGMPFIDLLASCDALITKPGYGSFAEAAANAVPVLYLPRPDWPETPWLTAWMQRVGRAEEVDEQDLRRDGAVGSLRSLCEQPQRPAVVADGARVAARVLAERFG